MIAKRATTPGAADQLLKKLKVLLHFAIDNGWRTDDPTLRIKKFPEGEYHTWTDVEIDQFEKAWPIGSRERMAFGLFLYTGQRTSIRHPGAILQTSNGRPFTSKGLSNFMADCFDGAGLPERCVTHGLRKATARRLAEAGCSTNEIASITGHASLEEVARYTKAAEQKLTRAAMNQLVWRRTTVEFPNQSGGLGKADEKSNDFNDKASRWRPVGASNPKETNHCTSKI